MPPPIEKLGDNLLSAYFAICQCVQSRQLPCFKNYYYGPEKWQHFNLEEKWWFVHIEGLLDNLVNISLKLFSCGHFKESHSECFWIALFLCLSNIRRLKCKWIWNGQVCDMLLLSIITNTASTIFGKVIIKAKQKFRELPSLSLQGINNC